MIALPHETKYYLIVCLVKQTYPLSHALCIFMLVIIIIPSFLTFSFYFFFLISLLFCVHPLLKTLLLSHEYCISPLFQGSFLHCLFIQSCCLSCCLLGQMLISKEGVLFQVSVILLLIMRSKTLTLTNKMTINTLNTCSNLNNMFTQTQFQISHTYLYTYICTFFVIYNEVMVNERLK